MSRVITVRQFWLLCGLAIVARVALTLTTVGTNDAMFWTTWLGLVKRVGIAASYSQTPMMNHPPPALLLMLLLDWLGRITQLSFLVTFRLAQIAADALSAFALYRLGAEQSAGRGRLLALFVMLSPAAAFVSAFHCNSDPLMTALMMLAAALLIASSRRPLASGAVLAAAGGIKIVPLLLLPLFLAFAEPHERKRFLAGFTLILGISFLPAVLLGGPVVISNIFGYAGGLPYEWGITGVSYALAANFPPLRGAGRAVLTAYDEYGRFVVYAAIAAVIVLVVRRRDARRDALPHVMAIMLLTILALAPGFGVQYVCWLVPLLPFALPWRGAIAMNGVLSLFLFITYTIWSGGWPWWFADIQRPGPYRYLPALAGYVTWALVAVCAIVAIQRFRSLRRSRTALQTPTAALPTTPGSD